MKKIGIITIIDNDNYGNRLQNYAMQRIIEDLGFEAITLKNNKRFNSKENCFKMLINFFDYCKKNIGILIKGNRKRVLNFNEFNKNIHITKKMINVYNSKKINNEYYKFVVGSDQVWKPIYGRMSYIDMLQFADNDKKIAYAPSFGISEIEDKYKLKLKDGLKNFDNLSVREEQGAKIIYEVTGKNAKVVLDPTLLVSKEEWEKVSERPKNMNDEKYILTYFLGSNYIMKQLEDIAKKENLKVINLMDKNSIFYESGPQHFLYLFKNAEVIFTDSFHACIFSMIFEKPFFVLDRKQNGMNNMNSRLDTLLAKFNQQDRKISDIESIENFYEIDYKEYKEIFKKEKNISLDFLREALENTNIKQDNNMSKTYFESNLKEDCNGCGVCELICPKRCIKMVEDGEGFLYPKIDKEKCINCGLCKIRCSNRPVENTYDIKAYAAINKNETERKESTSGGMFKILAKYVIENKGVVFGVKMDKELKVMHDYTETLEGCKEFSGSKYVRSDLGNSYQNVKEMLNKNRKVLFTGTPCQVEGLRRYLNKDDENLILCEIICHANPSPKVLKMYLKNKEIKMGKKVKKIYFRSKNQEMNNKAYIEFEDGTKVKENNYILSFSGEQLINRPSCNNCQFVSDNRKADFTIGDFWGVDKVIPNFNDGKGISIITVNTKKAEKIFGEINCNMKFVETDLKQAFSYNHYENLKPSKNRVNFFKGIADGSINENNISKYMNKYTQKKRLKNGILKAKKILKKSIRYRE